MRIVYTYEGKRDSDFESAILGLVQDRLEARQVSAEPTGDGYNRVTLETSLDHVDHDLVRMLRAHERVIDVTEGPVGPMI